MSILPPPATPVLATPARLLPLPARQQLARAARAGQPITALANQY